MDEQALLELIARSRLSGPMGDHDEIAVQLSKAVENPSLSAELRGSALLAYSVVAQGEISRPELLTMIERSIELLGDDAPAQLRASARANAASIAAMSNDLDRSLEHCLVLRRIAHDRSITLDTRTRLNFGVALVQLGAFAEAASWMLAALDIVAERGPELQRVSACMNLLIAITRDQRCRTPKERPPQFDLAMSTIDAAIASSLRDGPTGEVADFVSSIRAHRALAVGDIDAAAAIDRPDPLEMDPDWLFTGWFCLAEAYITLHLGDLDRADAVIGRLLASTEPREVFPLLRAEAFELRARLHAASGEHAAALDAAHTCAQETAATLSRIPDVLITQINRRADLEARASELRLQAMIDELSGVGNRRALEAHLESVRRGDTTKVMVMVLDIDNFKVINDTHGHALGDRIITDVGRLIARVSRSSDNVFRLGGDEFLVIADASRSDSRVGPLVRRRIERTLAEHDWSPLQEPLHYSIGIAEGSAADIVELMAIADRRMYASKQPPSD
ncbi:MAG: diguanylate cyclase [Actinomycetota bacterium]